MRGRIHHYSLPRSEPFFGAPVRVHFVSRLVFILGLLGLLSLSACTETIDYPIRSSGDSDTLIETCPPAVRPSCSDTLDDGETECNEDALVLCQVTWMPAPICRFTAQTITLNPCLDGCEQVEPGLAQCVGIPLEDGDGEEIQEDEEPDKWPETVPICSKPNQSGWCWEMPLPAGGTLRAVAVRGKETWFAGVSGLYRYEDGELLNEEGGPVALDLQALWLDPGGEGVLAVGRENGIYWNEGSGWNSRSTAGGPTLRGISATNISDLWITGDEQTSFHPMEDPLVMDVVPDAIVHLGQNCLPDVNEGFVIADKSALWSVTLDGWERLEEGFALNDLWCKDASDVFYLEGSSIWRRRTGFDKEALLAQSSNWNAIAGKGQRVWVVGNNGWTAHADILPSQTPSWILNRPPAVDFQNFQLYDVALSSAGDVAWAVGTGGSIFRYDGQTRWKSIVKTPQHPWRSVSVLPDQRAFLVGRQGVVADFARGNWTVQTGFEGSSGEDFVHVLALDENTAFAVTSSILYAYDGKTWSAATDAPDPGAAGWLKLLRYPGLDPDPRSGGRNILMLADVQGRVWHHLNGQWEIFATASFQLTDVWMTPGRTLWAAGDCRSCLTRYEKDQWTNLNVPDAGFQVITGSTTHPSLIYVVTTDSLWRFNGKWFAKAEDISFQGDKVIAWAGTRDLLTIIVSRFEGLTTAYEHNDGLWHVSPLPADGLWYGIDGGTIAQSDGSDLLDLRLVGEHGVLRRFEIINR